MVQFASQLFALMLKNRVVFGLEYLRRKTFRIAT